MTFIAHELDPVGDLKDILVATPRGAAARFLWRPETNDANLLIALSGHGDEYLLRERYLSGWAIDVGAHIGGVTIPLLIDNPELRVVAVEAVPENVDVLYQNLERNGVLDRVIVVDAAATGPDVESVRISWGYRSWTDGKTTHADDYVRAHRLIGNQYRHEGGPTDTINVPGVSLSDILDRFDIENVEFLKIDCEGCEWEFLTDPAVAQVCAIIGEMHAGYDAPREGSEKDETEWEPGCHRCVCRDRHLISLLESTHRVEIRGEVFEAWRHE